MRDLSRQLEIRLVTTKGGVTKVSADAKLAVAEFVDFALIECPPADMHDRNLRVDDQVFFLGTSVADAGTTPTNFAPGDSTPAGHGVLDSIMAKGARVV